MEFIHDETEINTPKVKVITKISKWDKYELVELDGKKCIRGYNVHPDSELFDFVEFSDQSILIALIQLKTKIKTPYSNNQDTIADNIANSDIDLLLEFCNRWGLPMWGKEPTENYCSNEDNLNMAARTITRPVVPLLKENYLYIPSFIQGIYMLYNDFLKVVVYNGWQEDINTKPLLKGITKNHLQNLTKSINSDFKIKHDIPAFTLYMANLMPFVTYWNNKEMCLQLNCENLMHLSVYFLCLWLQTSEFTGGYIKVCKKCGQMFITENSRKLFCENPCTRQAYYYKRKVIEKTTNKKER